MMTLPVTEETPTERRCALEPVTMIGTMRGVGYTRTTTSQRDTLSGPLVVERYGDLNVSRWF
jgi:hypothetical protein